MAKKKKKKLVSIAGNMPSYDMKAVKRDPFVKQYTDRSFASPQNAGLNAYWDKVTAAEQEFKNFYQKPVLATDSPEFQAQTVERNKEKYLNSLAFAINRQANDTQKEMDYDWKKFRQQSEYWKGRGRQVGAPVEEKKETKQDGGILSNVVDASKGVAGKGLSIVGNQVKMVGNIPLPGTDDNLGDKIGDSANTAMSVLDHTLFAPAYGAAGSIKAATDGAEDPELKSYTPQDKFVEMLTGGVNAREIGSNLAKDGKLKEVGSGFKKGLTNEEKFTMSDVIAQNAKQDTAKNMYDNAYYQGGVGFVGDVITDPLTYVGVGLVNRGAKAIKEGSSAARSLSGRGIRESAEKYANQNIPVGVFKGTPAESMFAKRSDDEVMSMADAVKVIGGGNTFASKAAKGRAVSDAKANTTAMNEFLVDRARNAETRQPDHYNGIIDRYKEEAAKSGDSAFMSDISRAAGDGDDELAAYLGDLDSNISSQQIERALRKEYDTSLNADVPSVNAEDVLGDKWKELDLPANYRNEIRDELRRNPPATTGDALNYRQLEAKVANGKLSVNQERVYRKQMQRIEARATAQYARNHLARTKTSIDPEATKFHDEVITRAQQELDNPSRAEGAVAGKDTSADRMQLELDRDIDGLLSSGNDYNTRQEFLEDLVQRHTDKRDALLSPVGKLDQVKTAMPERFKAEDGSLDLNSLVEQGAIKMNGNARKDSYLRMTVNKDAVDPDEAVFLERYAEAYNDSLNQARVNRRQSRIRSGNEVKQKAGTVQHYDNLTNLANINTAQGKAAKKLLPTVQPTKTRTVTKETVGINSKSDAPKLEQTVSEVGGDGVEFIVKASDDTPISVSDFTAPGNRYAKTAYQPVDGERFKAWQSAQMKQNKSGGFNDATKAEFNAVKNVLANEGIDVSKITSPAKLTQWARSNKETLDGLKKEITSENYTLYRQFKSQHGMTIAEAKRAQKQAGYGGDLSRHVEGAQAPNASHLIEPEEGASLAREVADSLNTQMADGGLTSLSDEGVNVQAVYRDIKGRAVRQYDDEIATLKAEALTPADKKAAVTQVKRVQRMRALTLSKIDEAKAQHIASTKAMVEQQQVSALLSLDQKLAAGGKDVQLRFMNSTLTLPTARMLGGAAAKMSSTKYVEKGLNKWAQTFQSMESRGPIFGRLFAENVSSADTIIAAHVQRLRETLGTVTPEVRKSAYAQMQWGKNAERTELQQQVYDAFADILPFVGGNMDIGPNKLTINDVGQFMPHTGTFGEKARNDYLQNPSVEGLINLLGSSKLGKGYKDPIDALYDLRIAAEKAYAHKSFMNSTGEQLGVLRTSANIEDSPVDKALIEKHGYKSFPDIAKEFNETHGRIRKGKGRPIDIRKYEEFANSYIFPPEVHRDMAQLMHMMEPNNIGQTMAMFDSATRGWKQLVTTYNIPAYYTRNAIGEVLQGAFDGVRNPKYYKRAAGMARYMRGEGAALDSLKKQHAFEGLSRQGIPSDNTVVVTLRNGQKLTAPEVQALYQDAGLKTGFVNTNQAENVEAGYRTATERAGDAIRSSRGAKAAVKANDNIKEWGEIAEDWPRMAHFLHALEDAPRGMSAGQAAVEAAARVRKYHFDYNDVTKAEQLIFARAIPFYKWTRKATPLMLQMMFARPGLAGMPDKFTHGLSVATGAIEPDATTGYDALGTEENVKASGFLNDGINMPDWARQIGAVPVGSDGGTFALIQTPFRDTATMFANPEDNALSMIHPLLLNAYQQDKGVDQYGNEFEGGADRLSALAQNTPMTKIMDRLLREDKDMEKHRWISQSGIGIYKDGYAGFNGGGFKTGS